MSEPKPSADREPNSEHVESRSTLQSIASHWQHGYRLVLNLTILVLVATCVLYLAYWIAAYAIHYTYVIIRVMVFDLFWGHFIMDGPVPWDGVVQDAASEEVASSMIWSSLYFVVAAYALWTAQEILADVAPDSMPWIVGSLPRSRHWMVGLFQARPPSRSKPKGKAKGPQKRK